MASAGRGAEDVVLSGRDLTLEEVALVARREAGPVRLSEEAAAGLARTCRLKDDLVRSGQAIYGVTTGFGDSVIRQVEPAKSAELQRNLIRYHVNGTDHDILPVVPERGSVGASGDLVPLCYIASALLGEGQVSHGGQTVPAREVLEQLGLEPLTLESKEGLALINGTSFSSAFAALATVAAGRLVRVAELCTAMTSEAVLGNRGHFAEFIHQSKPHPGQLASARAIAGLLADSQLALDHSQVVELTGGLGGKGYAELPRSIQDRYSIRCAPHIIGVLRDTAGWVRDWMEVEVNSSNDNPLFDAATGTAHSGGNFYGGHVAQAMDSLKVAVANIADLLDRQLEHIVDEKFSNGLTPNLVPWFDADQWRAGLHHGFKGMQIACSAITAEALKNSAPASVFSRSTEAHNQDKVSMCAIAARDARTVIALSEEVAAIHLLALCQALDLRSVDRSSTPIRAVHAFIREHVPPVRDDRPMDADIQAVIGLIRSGELTRELTDATQLCLAV